jgi:AraC family transcriptional regulator of adaptative response/methylated-DNA-[protein]-cysteine methyltransferase
MKELIWQSHYPIIEKALVFIQQNLPDRPSLWRVAEYCDLSEDQFRQIFKQWSGVTPDDFLQSLTKERVRTRLLNRDFLLQSSNNIKLDPVTPEQLKSRGTGTIFYYGLHPTPFGECFVATTERGIHQLDFIMPDNGIEFYLNRLRLAWPKADMYPHPRLIQTIVETSFVNTRAADSVKLWIKGSQFQLNVWKAVMSLPEGALCSYSSIAKAINKPLAARAVGSAVASNAIALLIPCHRIIQADGTLGHYRWGQYRKQALIGMEHVDKRSKNH